MLNVTMSELVISCLRVSIGWTGRL